jgi:hypothetical protein
MGHVLLLPKFSLAKRVFRGRLESLWTGPLLKSFLRRLDLECRQTDLHLLYYTS